MPAPGQRLPQRRRIGGRHGDLHTRLTRVARTGHDEIHAVPRHVAHPEPTDVGDARHHRSRVLPSVRALHRQHRASRGDVLAAERVEHTVGVGGVRHHVERRLDAVDLGMPPDDDVVEHRTVCVVEQVRVLRPTRTDLAKIVRQRRLQPIKRVVTGDPNGAEVRDVEDDRVLPARKMFVDRARVLERHVPAAERHHLGVERTMDRVER